MSEKIKVLYILPNCRKTGPTQQIFNLISNLDDERFLPCVVTIYPESNTEPSWLEKYKKVVDHKYIPVSKIDTVIGRNTNIKRYINEFKPNIVHSSGILPDYMVYRLGIKNHVLTSRNYVYEDYPAKYGRLKGTMLAKLHLKAIKNTRYARTCSESLHNIYLQKLSLDIPFIRNGVDLSTYYPTDDKKSIREALGLPNDKVIVVYGASFNNRKNHEFLLEAFTKEDLFKEIVLLLLGDGDNFERLKSKYDCYDNILMPGTTDQMPPYLRACDYYVSTSKSEGLPNGVLEAMASGLPVLLSDIEQHRELISADTEAGFTYKSDNIEDFQNKLRELINSDYLKKREHAILSVKENFSAKIMSEKYQTLYYEILGRVNRNGKSQKTV